MGAKVLWTLPVPSTGLLEGGPKLQVRPRREVAIRFVYEDEEGRSQESSLVVRGVEAFKCTYYRARDWSMHEVYDRLMDRGATPWLAEIIGSLNLNGGNSEGLVHLMINVDDGPCYEFVCRTFVVE
jgi:hypothetical protein